VFVQIEPVELDQRYAKSRRGDNGAANRFYGQCVDQARLRPQKTEMAPREVVKHKTAGDRGKNGRPPPKAHRHKRDAGKEYHDDIGLGKCETVCHQTNQSTERHNQRRQNVIPEFKGPSAARRFPPPDGIGRRVVGFAVVGKFNEIAAKVLEGARRRLDSSSASQPWGRRIRLSPMPRAAAAAIPGVGQNEFAFVCLRHPRQVAPSLLFGSLTDAD